VRNAPSCPDLYSSPPTNLARITDPSASSALPFPPHHHIPRSTPTQTIERNTGESAHLVWHTKFFILFLSGLLICAEAKVSMTVSSGDIGFHLPGTYKGMYRCGQKRE
jgi:hypothetical protein